jgi:hypothetical protein
MTPTNFRSTARSTQPPWPEYGGGKIKRGADRHYPLMSLKAIVQLGDNAADSGIITETSWNAVTIAWNNGKVASVHHGDMGEIQQEPTTSIKILAIRPSSTAQ